MSTSSIDLPDPTADLHWSDYRGAIHDIFAENAKKHPERLCVVETQSSKTPRRAFTYSQINETSNQVAHHLLENGVERGDVVMIYAHRGQCLSLKASKSTASLYLDQKHWHISTDRVLKLVIGVDLVVAVFGVLKAVRCMTRHNGISS